MAKNEIRFDMRNATAAVVGKADGLTPAELKTLGSEASRAVQRVNDTRAKTPFRDLPTNPENSQVDAVLKSVKKKKGRFDDLVILGIGGSALGLTALKTALRLPYWNQQPAHKRRGRPRLWVMDNVDPAEFAALLDLVDVERTLFNVISKSGDTAETMTQFLMVLDVMKDCIGKRWRKNLVITTGLGKSTLRDYLNGEKGIDSFIVPNNVGGRFSVLSPVGLFPAAMIGIDVEALLAGAAAMDKRCTTTAFAANPAAQGAAVQIGLYRRGKPLSVMMPYAAALKDVADWYRQLWAESLGKIRKDDGAFVGPTPIKALGVTDQHSQVQLYREGPNDKVFTILSVEDFGHKNKIPAGPEGLGGIDYLVGRTMARLYKAEEQATIWALSSVSKRPVTKIVLPEVTPFTVGQLLQMLMIQTSIAGEMLDLGEDTYLQPGVEAAKEATRALMGKNGPVQKPEVLPKDCSTYKVLRERIKKET